jgi:thioredoxin
MQPIAAAARRRSQLQRSAPLAPRRRIARVLPALFVLLLAAVGSAPPAAAAGRPAARDKSSDLTSRLRQSSVPVLVEFWAPWCAPCRRLKQPLDELSREMNGRLRIVRVNFDNSPRSAQRYGVELLPTLMLFDRGVEVDRLTGVPSLGELRSRLDQVLSRGAAEPTMAAAAESGVGVPTPPSGRGLPR